MGARQTHFIMVGPTELSYVQEIIEHLTNQSATTQHITNERRASPFLSTDGATALILALTA